MPFINNNLLTRAHKEPAYDSVYQADVLTRYTAIQRNHDHSTSILDKLATALTSQLDSKQHERTSVVVFGSYGRRDASPQPDLDNVVLTTSERPASTNDASSVLSTVLAELSIPPPNARGVFSGSAYDASSLENEIGGVKDDYNSMSRRLLLLLESRPIFGPAVHGGVVERLVRLYGGDVEEDPRKNYVFLLNDVIRYFRTICVNYQHTKLTEVEKWPIRNIKLRHSCLVMYASLVAMLGVLSTIERRTRTNDWTSLSD
jgi:predicted nucleotidyltransferase